MGLILDSTVLITAERKGETVAAMLERILSGGDEPLGISTIALVELAHGIHRANTPEIRARREAFVKDLLSSVPSYELTVEVALLAARIDAEQQMQGLKIPFSDLLIGATALHAGYEVLTANERHFAMIPGLGVRPL